MSPVYLDHHATTPVDPRVLEAMRPYQEEAFANPSSKLHEAGRRAAEAVEEARYEVAGLIGDVPPREVIFTSGGTEADNLAVLGVARAQQERGRTRVVTTVVEHPAVLEACAALERWEGFEVVRVAVDEEGFVDLDRLEDALGDGRGVALCSVIGVHNEIGTVQPLRAIGERCRRVGVPLHSDAVQGLGKLPMDLDLVDLVSVNAHKMYGPKGVGALWVRSGTPLQPILHGGGQERGLRSGTLNVPGIVGLGEASRIGRLEGVDEFEGVRELRDRFFARLADALDLLHVNGPPLDGPRHPGNLNVSFLDVEANALLLDLVDDVAASTGSACATGSGVGNATIGLLGLGDARATSSVRFGLGRGTTWSELEAVADRVIEAVRAHRDRSPTWRLRQEGVDPASIDW